MNKIVTGQCQGALRPGRGDFGRAGRSPVQFHWVFKKFDGLAGRARIVADGYF